MIQCQGSNGQSPRVPDCFLGNMLPWTLLFAAGGVDEYPFSWHLIPCEYWVGKPEDRIDHSTWFPWFPHDINVKGCGPQQALWGFCVQLSPGLIDFIVTWQTEQNISEYQTHPQKKASSNFQTNQLGPGRVTYVLLASVRGKTCLCNCNHRNIHSFRCFAGTYSSEPSLQTGYSAIGQSTKT